MIWQIASEKRHVKAGIVGLLIKRSLHQGIRDHSNDCPPSVRPAGIKNPNLMTNRTLIAPILSSKARVHDRYPLLGIGIIESEVAPFKKFQTERVEIIVRNVFKISRRTVAVGQIILSVSLVLTGGGKCHPETTGQ